jgi:hypothetical protein
MTPPIAHAAAPAFGSWFSRPAEAAIGNSIKELTLPLSSNTVTQGIIQS